MLITKVSSVPKYLSIVATEACPSQLDLLQVPAGPATQRRARSAKIMRCEVAERGLCSVFENEPPDNFLIRNAFPDNIVALVDRAEDPAACNRSRFRLLIDTNFHHRRSRNSSNADAFSSRSGMTCCFENYMSLDR